MLRITPRIKVRQNHVKRKLNTSLPKFDKLAIKDQNLQKPNDIPKNDKIQKTNEVILEEKVQAALKLDKKLEDYIAPLGVEDTNHNLTEEHIAVVNKWLGKLYDEQEVFFKDIELSYITNIKQRTYYKIIQMWLADIGDTRKGYKEFITSLLFSVNIFEVGKQTNAYLQLLECFPQSIHTGIRRVDTWQTILASHERLGDHELADYIVRCMERNDAPANDIFRSKMLQIFGPKSYAVATVNKHLHLKPRLDGINISTDYNHVPTLLEPPDVRRDPVKAAFLALRQMAPGIYTDLKRFPIDQKVENQLALLEKKNNLEIKEKDLSPYEAQLKKDAMSRKAFSNAIISAQSDEMIEALEKHDPSLPIIISGPYVVYVKGKRVKYFMIKSGSGGKFDMSVYEDPDQYQVLEYDKWWKDNKKFIWDTTDNLTHINATAQKVLPDIGQRLKDKFVKGDMLHLTPHSQLDELKMEEDFEANTYAIACFGSVQTETCLLEWVKNLAIGRRENAMAFANSALIFQKTMLLDETQQQTVDESTHFGKDIDGVDETHNTFLNESDIANDCFLGTAPEMMPPIEEMDQIMVGVDLETDWNLRQEYGDKPNAKMFETFADYVPYLPEDGYKPGY